jgi:glycosyltransferase involved in cell wall biosynthesis
LIVSNMGHYLDADGGVVGHGPTVQEIDHLAGLFESVRHVACQFDGPPPRSALPYRSDRVSLVPMPPSGGTTVRAKLDILRRAPLYVRTVARELRRADVVHVRAPANIPLFTLLLLALLRRPRPRWVKYAGNWRRDEPTPMSFAFQRWWLRRGLHRGAVTVNGPYPDDPSWVRHFYNPALSDTELRRARAAVASKRLEPPYRVLFVGAMAPAKGVDRLASIANELVQLGLDFRMDVIGDGALRGQVAADVAAAGLGDIVQLHGFLPRPAVADFYERAHLLLLPSRTEGLPKVLEEAAAFGAVPVANAVSMIPRLLEELGCGITVSPHDNDQVYARAVFDLLRDPDAWHKAAEAGGAAAERFSYAWYLRDVERLFAEVCGLKLAQPEPPPLR